MKSKRHIYLQMKSLEEAQAIFFNRFCLDRYLQQETIPTQEAAGRVTAEPVFARFSSPSYHAAAMDGIAVRAETTFGTTVDRPKNLRIGKDAFFVNTGHMMPEGTNAVIMIEHVVTLDEETVQIESAAYPWQHVRKVGEDIVATELILPQNHLITPYEIGALLNGGVFDVKVKQRPRVLIIPTGSELMSPQDLTSDTLPPGRVVESNSAILGALIGGCGGEYVSHPIVPDIFEEILNAVREATTGDVDLVIVSAGSSAGSEDYTASVMAELGEVLVHGVTIMPGKPTLLGVINNKPVIGNPGYTVSAIMAFEKFVQPLISRMLGIRETHRPKIKVRTARKMASKLGIEEFVRVKLGRVKDTVVASSLPRGAGSVTTLTEADGIIRIPNHVEGIKAGEEVEAELLKDLSQIENTVVIVGSHDNTLDILANQMRVRDYRFSLSSSNVGSLGGLIALRNGYCHAAGSHLLDTDTGTYNISYVKRYIPNLSVKLVNLVYRQQGLIVPRGNPKGISGIQDLARDDITFVNRQAGSGTRILLDYRLAELDIAPESIRGYDQEEFTHMSVAVSVLSGAADTGLGIYAAARALNLDFIPIVTEQYDLVIPEAFLEDEKIQLMLEVVRSDRFKQLVDQLGGYDTSKTGTVFASL
ncbi:MAG: molybdopterin biosynthesis protein [Deltaproteobacteria bacterium]|nr:molybdopterin biosynthesis protein [Deltaproteobacteria bacterium]MBW2074217.1 molybdopterin biosynthesis protein [Deltaproteobacteria bacterium]